jgi:AcrR family transcriptional regulator
MASARADTRGRILDATLETLRTVGFAGATSRAIARAAGVNQALVFYHFGSLDALLLAALDQTSEERLARYRAAVAEAQGAEELAGVLARVYQEDRDSGHMSVVAQMVAGSVAHPQLAPAMLERMRPWLKLAEEALRKAEIPEVVPLPDLAYAVVTFYLGVNLLTHLDQDRSRTDALFAHGPAVAKLFAS